MTETYPRSLPELTAAFTAISAEISTTVRPLDAALLHTAPDSDSWSIRELLDHLVRSVQPVAKALDTPRRVLMRSFGSPEDPSRNFDVIRAVYRSELAGGAVAAGPFLPDESRTDGELKSEWEAAVHAFHTGLDTWTDSDLDTHQLPHPLIGMLTMREMVMFSIYHCRHHYEEILAILG